MLSIGSSNQASECPLSAYHPVYSFIILSTVQKSDDKRKRWVSKGSTNYAIVYVFKWVLVNCER